MGDTAHVPLPQWVLRCGENDPDLFFTDRPRGGSQGQRNREYLSVWADDAQGVLHGRSPMQCYEDFMASFRDNFLQVTGHPCAQTHAAAQQPCSCVIRAHTPWFHPQDLGGMVEEVVVGAGPCGELRFPSYVEANGWRFPGVGEFQVRLRALAACSVGGGTSFLGGAKVLQHAGLGWMQMLSSMPLAQCAVYGECSTVCELPVLVKRMAP